MKKVRLKLITVIVLSTIVFSSCSKENAPLKELQQQERKNSALISIKAEGNLEILSGAAAEKELSEILSPYKGKSLENLSISGRSLKQKDLDFIKTAFKSLDILDLTEATLTTTYYQYGFKSNQTLRKVILPKNLSQIGEGHFGYSNIEEVVFTGNKLKSIGDNAFALSKKIKSLNLPASLSNLDREAFAYMSSLETIEIPEQVTIIPDRCFRLDEALKSVTFKGEVIELGNEVFSLCSNLEEIKFTQSTPPQFNEGEWPFVEAEYFNNANGTPRLHFLIPKGSLNAYLKAWKFEGQGDKAYFIEY